MIRRILTAVAAWLRPERSADRECTDAQRRDAADAAYLDARELLGDVHLTADEWTAWRAIERDLTGPGWSNKT